MAKHNNAVGVFESLGYIVTRQLINARSFGSKQHQRRLLLMGVQHGLNNEAELSLKGILSEDSDYFPSGSIHNTPGLISKITQLESVTSQLAELEVHGVIQHCNNVSKT